MNADPTRAPEVHVGLICGGVSTHATMVSHGEARCWRCGRIVAVVPPDHNCAAKESQE